MKFICQKEELGKQLQHVSRIVVVRGSVPILSNILIETDKDKIRISSTDLEIAMSTVVKAQIIQEGSFTVPAKLFQDFINQNPDDEVEFSLESFELICKSERVEVRISGLDSEEYPELPKVEKGVIVKFPLTSFVEAMKQVIIACATDVSRPTLTSVNVRLMEDMAVFAATDSFRLVERKIKILPIQQFLTFLIPARTVQEIIKASVSLEDGDLEMEVSEDQVLFRIGTIELYSRLTSGAFPKYEAIIPTKFEVEFEVATSEFIQALRLLNVFSQVGILNALIEINESGSVSITTYGAQRGSGKHSIYAVVKEGFKPLQVPFNVKYLLDACSAARAQSLNLQFSGVTSALVISTNEEGYLQLVMPVRLNS